MLMSARPISRITHLSHQDSCPAAHGSHLTANKVPNCRERRRFRGIEESDRTREARQEDGQKTKQEGQQDLTVSRETGIRWVSFFAPLRMRAPYPHGRRLTE
ncbi:hypothetical protein ElyMa_001676000 [Elysia marginata]|uniref:Uncharacterized protein n=1 Tax=Elysia marginata TaxID=1093978 RepID=A0AAV4JVM2_9GAST|nr:hypothetical protein ElyMa_001676000 [Elysia marginata]